MKSLSRHSVAHAWSGRISSSRRSRDPLDVSDRAPLYVASGPDALAIGSLRSMTVSHWAQLKVPR